MKLNYQFEIMEIDDSYMAVPVGENAENLHAALELNEVAAKMLKRIAESQTPEEAHRKICEDYPNETKDEVGVRLAEFLNELVREGLLTP